MLIEKSNKDKLSQSEFIRNLISDYSVGPKPKIDINNINVTIKSSIEDLAKFRTKCKN